jgi:hypothetical protein
MLMPAIQGDRPRGAVVERPGDEPAQREGQFRESLAEDIAWSMRLRRRRVSRPVIRASAGVTEAPVDVVATDTAAGGIVKNTGN